VAIRFGNWQYHLENPAELKRSKMALGQISLTFDDALDQHLDHAVPLLDRYQLRGTFYTHLTAPAFGRRLDEWREIARHGHELGNHTIFHPADARKPWVRQGNAIDHYTLDRMRMELEAANQLLTAIDGQTERSFAYPCSNPIIGRRGLAKIVLFGLGMEHTRFPGWVDRLHIDFGSTRTSYSSIVREMFVASRGGGLTLGATPPPVAALDRAWVPSAAVQGEAFATLRSFVERAVEANAWAILQFHGLGGGHRMDCGLQVFRDLVAWLAEEYRDRTVTVLAGANKIWNQDRSAPAVGSASAALSPLPLRERGRG
jgi:sialate O-acetylesterase